MQDQEEASSNPRVFRKKGPHHGSMKISKIVKEGSFNYLRAMMHEGRPLHEDLINKHKRVKEKYTIHQVYQGQRKINQVHHTTYMIKEVDSFRRVNQS